MVAGIIALALALGITAISSTISKDQTATVLTIINGDTFDVDRDGETVRIHLLNVDSPTAASAAKAARCMGPEATAFLESMLPIGSTVRLEHDTDQDTQHDENASPVLARAYVGDTFVDAEIARAGLGVAVDTGNAQVYDTVHAAQAEAVAAERGLYSVDEACTIPHLVQAYEQATTLVTEAVSTNGALSTEELEAYSVLVVTLAAPVTGLTTLMAGSDQSVYPMLAFADGTARSTLLSHLKRTAASTATDLENAQSVITSRITARKEAAAAAQRAAEEAAAAAEAQRVADEAAAAAAAEAEAQRLADAEAQRLAAAESQRQANASKAQTPTTAPKTTNSGSVDKYTGCRAYGPRGTSVDSKGRRYTKIACP